MPSLLQRELKRRKREYISSFSGFVYTFLYEILLHVVQLSCRNGGEDIDMHKIEDRSKTPRMTVVPPGVTPVMTPEEEEEAFVPPGVTPGMTPEEKEEEEEEEAFVPPGNYRIMCLIMTRRNKDALK